MKAVLKAGLAAWRGVGWWRNEGIGWVWFRWAVLVPVWMVKRKRVGVVGSVVVAMVVVVCEVCDS